MKPDDAAKAAAKADREAHKAEPDDPRDTGIDADLDDTITVFGSVDELIAELDKGDA